MVKRNKMTITTVELPAFRPDDPTSGHDFIVEGLRRMNATLADADEAAFPPAPVLPVMDDDTSTREVPAFVDPMTRLAHGGNVMITAESAPRRIHVTVTRYDGDQPFPEADFYDEFVRQALVRLFPGSEVSCQFGARTQVFVDEDETVDAHEISALVRVGLWDEFCQTGYLAFSRRG